MTRIAQVAGKIVAALIAALILCVATSLGSAATLPESPTTLACHGSMLGQSLSQPVVGIASTPDQGGYWLVASDGGVFSFGDAQFYGSASNLPLNRPMVGMAATPDGLGYWLVGTDGGVFSFGDAHYLGSAVGLDLNRPIVGMAATPDGRGYWLVAADGGVFSFGDAAFLGSTGSMTLDQPIVAMAASTTGTGYWLAASDGGIFAFGSATFFGSGPDQDPGVTQFTAFAATTDGQGYILGNASRAIELLAFGDARYAGDRFNPADASVLVGLTQPVATADYAYWDASAAGGVALNPGPAFGLGSQTSC